jgi:hypothetical protein
MILIEEVRTKNDFIANELYQNYFIANESSGCNQIRYLSNRIRVRTQIIAYMDIWIWIFDPGQNQNFVPIKTETAVFRFYQKKIPFLLHHTNLYLFDI